MLAKISDLNVLGNLRLEMINQNNRGCHHRAIVDMHQHYGQVTPVSLKEHSLVDIAPREPKFQHDIDKFLIPAPSRLLESIEICPLDIDLMELHIFCGGHSKNGSN